MKLDDYSFRFIFSKPNGLFLQHLVVQNELTKYPRHHFEQFHLDYTPDVEALAADEGFSTWVERFTNRAEKWQHVGVPLLTPWVTDQPLGEGTGARFIVVRNPYYWKTDPKGSQLPYLDRVVFEIVGDQELMVLKITNGEIDMHSRHVMSSRNKPIFAKSREQSGYEFFEVRTTDFNEMGVYLNLSHPDPVLRKIFGTKDFRIALSHAINRQEIIDAIFQRQGQPWQLGQRPESPFFDEQLATQYLEYDPKFANRMHDDAGFHRAERPRHPAATGR